MKAVAPQPSARSRDRFLANVRAWAVRLKVRPTSIQLRPMTRKWGSCSTAGRLSFSRHLLQQPRRFRDHVVVHELLHLRLPNHGKLFQQLLALYAPDPHGER
ncbi:MAG: M48 family metallopeptidase [Gammaproteobacteria bacterium]|nr:M48 family metallopeptidase [Gammaproteobacteria bacterium]